MWAAQVWLRDFKRDLISAISFKMEVPRFVFKQLVGTFLKRILSMKLWSWIVRHARETILYIFWKLVIIPQTCKFLNKCWLQKSLSHIWAAQVWLNYFTMGRFTPWCVSTNHRAQNYHSHTHTHSHTHSHTHCPYVVIASLKAVRLENALFLKKR